MESYNGEISAAFYYQGLRKFDKYLIRLLGAETRSIGQQWAKRSGSWFLAIEQMVHLMLQARNIPVERDGKFEKVTNDLEKYLNEEDPELFYDLMSHCFRDQKGYRKIEERPSVLLVPRLCNDVLNYRLVYNPAKCHADGTRRSRFQGDRHITNSECLKILYVDNLPTIELLWILSY